MNCCGTPLPVVSLLCFLAVNMAPKGKWGEFIGQAPLGVKIDAHVASAGRRMAREHLSKELLWRKAWHEQKV